MRASPCPAEAGRGPQKSVRTCIHHAQHATEGTFEMFCLLAREALHHGEMLGDRHAWGKMSIYNAAYHTPLIIRAPQLQAQSGMQVQLQTESVDIAPTILDWIGKIQKGSP